MSLKPAKASVVPSHPQTADGRTPLSTLISLQRDVRNADSMDKIGFIAVNQTNRLLDYFQCVLWQFAPGGKVKVRTVSGISDFDRHSQVVLSLQRLINVFASSEKAKNLTAITSADLPASMHKDWLDWMPEHGLWCPFKRPTGEIYAGLLITRATAFDGSEIQLIDPLVDAYSLAGNALESGDNKTKKRMSRLLRKRVLKIGVLVLAAAVLALPVRESALAPGEIIPFQPLVVSAPVRGVIQEFHIRPNERVAADQLLFSMDDTEIKSQYEIATKSYDVAVADYRRAAQKSFSDRQSKSELELFKARADEKRLQRDYARTLLDRTKVRAERNGVAVLADTNDWIGRPVEVGQRVLTLADPKQMEIQIWLAIEDGINLEQGSDVQMFLNTDPTSPLEATIRQTSYAPEEALDGDLAFRLKANLAPNQGTPRIGLKGTAKIYGEKVSLFYHIMRRPLSVLRQTLGI